MKTLKLLDVYIVCVDRLRFNLFRLRIKCRCASSPFYNFEVTVLMWSSLNFVRMFAWFRMWVMLGKKLGNFKEKRCLHYRSHNFCPVSRKLYQNVVMFSRSNMGHGGSEVRSHQKKEKRLEATILAQFSRNSECFSCWYSGQVRIRVKTRSPTHIKGKHCLDHSFSQIILKPDRNVCLDDL